MACQGGAMPPPQVRVMIAYFLLLLHDSARRPQQKLHFVACRRCPVSRYHRATIVPTTLHVRPTHVPTANSTVIEV